MYMLEESCALLRKWLDRGGACVPLAVNQSRVNMYNASYLSRILEITGRYRIPHELLDFEITESAMTNDAGQVREQFRQLRALGFSTSVDDFGNGFSSLSTLRDIEADTIKIDRYFFNEAFDSPEGKYTVETIISLVKGLRYRVIAEGIETAEQVEFLRHSSVTAYRAITLANLSRSRRLNAGISTGTREMENKHKHPTC